MRASELKAAVAHIIDDEHQFKKLVAQSSPIALTILDYHVVVTEFRASKFPVCLCHNL